MQNIKQFIVTYKKKIVSICAVVVIIIIIVSIRTISENTPSIVSVENKALPEQVATKPAPVVDPLVMEADKKKLSELKTKFNYEYDEFENKGWYFHKTQIVQNTFDKKVLKVYVNNVGYAYLMDQYYADDWLFHTRLEVKIGDNLYKTEDIPTYDSNNSTEIGSGSIWENVSYTAGRDNGIIKAIAQSGTTPIKVRFTGDRGVYDMTLSDRDRQAIKDSYELSELIKKTGDTGANK
jgi:hypothetical protein